MIDASTDYLLWDNTQTVQYYPSPRREAVTFPVAHALRRAPTFRELLPSGGGYTASDVVWLLPVATSQALTDHFPARPGDIIEDANDTAWTVLSVGLNTWGTWWRIQTRNLVLAYGLRDTIKIVRPSITVGPGGEPVYTWPPQGGELLSSGMQARVQPQSSQPDVVNEVETMQTRYTVILVQQVDLIAADRIEVINGIGVPSGTVLQVQGIHNAERIDELPAVDCLRV